MSRIREIGQLADGLAHFVEQSSLGDGMIHILLAECLNAAKIDLKNFCRSAL